MDVTQRFSNRVENYIKYRPSYPTTLIDHIVARAGLQQGSAVADVGSGTGIFTALLLARGLRVYGVEPNREMREAAERLIAGNKLFVSIDSGAERTTLPDGSVEIVCAAQAFHWFDATRTRAEFHRILKPGGLVALVWNDRKVDASPFLQAYDELLRTRGTDYEQVNHRNIDADKLHAFFGKAGYEETTFANAQHFDWDGLYGRAMSSSYVPAEGSDGFASFVAGLREIFGTHAQNGHVTFEYDTRLYMGALP
jgi:ubiquinone/menaquinone biosynthesis C-methylase UbiE